MARRAEINYWKSRQAYGCWIAGKQYILAKGPKDGPLGPTYKAAEKKFEDIAAQERFNSSAEGNLVKALCRAYCCYLVEHRSSNTLRIRQGALAAFVKEFGGRYMSSLVPHEVDVWLAKMKREHGWGVGQRCLFVASIKAAINWAVRQGRCLRNPLVGLEPGGEAENRAQKILVDEALWAKMIARMRPDGRELATVLRLTGARPGEIANARGEDFDHGRQAIVYPWRGNSAGFKPKTHASRRDRVIYLAGEALKIVRRRMERYGAGYLFPRHVHRGKTIDEPRSMNAMTNIFRRLGERLDIKGLSPYCLRHSFITNWLADRDDIETLSELVGSSPNTIRKHYKHFDRKRDLMRSRLESFVTTLQGNTSADQGSAADQAEAS